MSFNVEKTTFGKLFKITNFVSAVQLLGTGSGRLRFLNNSFATQPLYLRLCMMLCHKNVMSLIMIIKVLVLNLEYAKYKPGYNNKEKYYTIIFHPNDCTNIHNSPCQQNQNTW